MKTLKNILVIGVIAMSLTACKNESQPEVIAVETEIAAELDPNATYAKAEFNIEGMTCEIGCAKTIEKKLAGLQGVKSASVDFENELAMVEFDEAKVTTVALEETVKKAGEVYSTKNMKTVESFSAKKGHPENCDQACCKDKTEAEKKACSEDCKMACCAEKKSKTE